MVESSSIFAEIKIDVTAGFDFHSGHFVADYFSNSRWSVKLTNKPYKESHCQEVFEVILHMHC